MSEPDDSPELQAQIDAAHQAGDLAKENELYLRQIGNVDHSGDKAEAAAVEAGALAVLKDAKADDAPADADPAELSEAEALPATAMDEYQPWDALTEAEKDGEFESVMARSDPEMSSRELRVAWPGGDYDRNAEIIVATLKAIPGSAAAMRVLEVAGGVANHPDVMKWVAQVGRLLAVIPGDASTIKDRKAKAMTTDTMNTAAIEAKIKGIHQEMEKASAENDFGEANRLYLIEQELYGRLPGAGEPIVGSGGRTV